MSISLRYAPPAGAIGASSVVKIAGGSLAAGYRDGFAEEIRSHGIDGLINLLSGKNRQNAAKALPASA
jgi:hypothetical protein